MKTDEYRKYLKLKFPNNPTTVNNAISICKKVEAYHGNLDDHLSDDNYDKLLYLLTYTIDDERKNKKAKHSIPTSGDLKNNTTTYKKWVISYKVFCEQNSSGENHEITLTKDKRKGFEQTSTKNKRQLNLRSIDAIFENLKELEDFFVEGVLGNTESPDDVEEYEYLAYKYFKNLEGEWFFRENESNAYLKLVPSKVKEDRKLKIFFEELVERTGYLIEDAMLRNWAED